MEKLLILTGDDLCRPFSRPTGLLKSRKRFMFSDLVGGGLGEPTEISELAGLGVLCGIFRWFSASHLAHPGYILNSFSTLLSFEIKYTSS